jgi:hypothetical protein
MSRNFENRVKHSLPRFQRLPGLSFPDKSPNQLGNLHRNTLSFCEDQVKIYFVVLVSTNNYDFAMVTTPSLVSASSSQSATQPTPASDIALETQRLTRLMQAMKAQYQADQQAKFLNLHAEAEDLLEQLRRLKQQRETLSEPVLAEASA